MLLRIWRTEFDPARRDELERFAEQVSAPMLLESEGCLGYLYACTGSTWITQTYWVSREAIYRAEASAAYRNVVRRILATGLLGEVQTTEVMEIVGGSAPGRRDEEEV